MTKTRNGDRRWPNLPADKLNAEGGFPFSFDQETPYVCKSNPAA
jgi:hypothetical protein